MPACEACGAELPDDVTVCSLCGTERGEADGQTGPAIRTAEYEPDAEREAFERRYGIDIGDRTVDEYLEFLEQQDYRLTPWFWSVVGTEVAGIVLFFSIVFSSPGWGQLVAYVFLALSLGLALAIFADSRTVGQFRQWARIRWTYVLFAAIPLLGHLMGGFYLVLRRLKHEQTIEQRRRLLNDGFDLGGAGMDD